MSDERKLEPIPVRCGTCIWWRSVCPAREKMGVCWRFPASIRVDGLSSVPASHEYHYCGEWKSSTLTLPEAVSRDGCVKMRPVEAPTGANHGE